MGPYIGGVGQQRVIIEGVPAHHTAAAHYPGVSAHAVWLSHEQHLY